MDALIYFNKWKTVLSETETILAIFNLNNQLAGQKLVVEVVLVPIWL